MGSLGTSDPLLAIAMRAAHARSAVSKHLLEKYKVKYKQPDAESLPFQAHVIQEPHTHNDEDGGGDLPDRNKKICIIGAGAAGLAAAMSLHEAEFYNIDILTLDLLAKLKVNTTRYYYGLKGLSAKQSDEIVPKMWYFENSRPESKKFADVMDRLLLQQGFLVRVPGDKDKRQAGNFEEAYDNFMNDKLDKLSTRSYLLTKDYTYEETLYAELAVSGRNDSFDQALLETVCDYLDFQQAENADWYRVEGGMEVLVKAMVDEVAKRPETKLKTNTAVVALKNDEDRKKIIVTTESGDVTEYDAVFNTTSMPCLERMDISELGLSKKILTGIRSLHYDNSAKVAIKFKKAWWMPLLKVPGGVSATDLPISNIVYPSFDIAEDEPAVLLASYSWSQDAIRMAALFDNSKPGACEPNVEDEVVKQVLKNIAQVWSKSKLEHPPTYGDLRDMYLNHFAWSWDQDKYTGGAFALFGPGQFQNFYADFQDPQCQGKFMMCGEAISVEHAWISGALKSAYCAVLKWTRKRDLKCGHGDICQTLLKRSILGGGKGEHPLELDENLLYWTVDLQNVELDVAAPKLAAAAA
ncbi:uncharacterized protein B0I36DRAFT_366334 [Microdochium trichocladiopsis]|uniref:Amine oxidase domain-containing protein n=1 Tax=Microdochium trichocladiopsis TaxID=1682393 RepID=A0A9P9BPB9_9PEZI|nr:uncharacterized protein B0I36DRAFT_366334 [Microdochium trichocladiopsis]KAH7024386.1 hypothetical protein B0I36DRAFT_366334 [Microdochium trichocladiopsis]